MQGTSVSPRSTKARRFSCAAEYKRPRIALVRRSRGHALAALPLPPIPSAPPLLTAPSTPLGPLPVCDLVARVLTLLRSANHHPHFCAVCLARLSSVLRSEACFGSDRWNLKRWVSCSYGYCSTPWPHSDIQTLYEAWKIVRNLEDARQAQSVVYNHWRDLSMR